MRPAISGTRDVRGLRWKTFKNEGKQKEKEAPPKEARSLGLGVLTSLCFPWLRRPECRERGRPLVRRRRTQCERGRGREISSPPPAATAFVAWAPHDAIRSGENLSRQLLLRAPESLLAQSVSVQFPADLPVDLVAPGRGMARRIVARVVFQHGRVKAAFLGSRVRGRLDAKCFEEIPACGADRWVLRAAASGTECTGLHGSCEASWMGRARCAPCATLP